MFVSTAAYEGKLAARNALSNQPSTTVDVGPLPWVIFTDPQVEAWASTKNRLATKASSRRVEVLGEMWLSPP